jgi:hypothetical protein
VALNAKRILVVALGVVAVALALPGYASASYGWPLKPFNRAHPVRGQLNDPRNNDLTFDSASSRSFHQGLDISAPDGTAVYAVAPGRVHYKDPTALAVRGKNDAVIFGYWHIVPAVRDHEIVKLHQLLGYINVGYGHVHFAEKRNRWFVNPLRRGGLTPYTDTTPPTINSISYYDGAYHDLSDTTLSGAVRITVNAYDTPQLVSNWPLAVVTPAWIGWQLFNADGQEIETGDWDFRYVLCPLNPTDVFAPGTRKNGSHTVASYNYWIGTDWDTNLIPDGKHWQIGGPEWLTTLVPNGTYRLVVTVADTRGNESTKTVSFTVANEPATSNPA